MSSTAALESLSLSMRAWNLGPSFRSSSTNAPPSLPRRFSISCSASSALVAARTVDLATRNVSAMCRSVGSADPAGTMPSVIWRLRWSATNSAERRTRVRCSLTRVYSPYAVASRPFRRNPACKRRKGRPPLRRICVKPVVGSRHHRALHPGARRRPRGYPAAAPADAATLILPRASEFAPAPPCTPAV